MTMIDTALHDLMRTPRPEYIGGTEDAARGSSQAIRGPDGTRYATIRTAIAAVGLASEKIQRLLSDPHSGWTRIREDE